MASSAESDEVRLRELGVRLKSLRKLSRLSLQAVAAGAGVSPSFLSMLERGQTDVSLSRFSRLADFYGLSLSELWLEGDVQPSPPQIRPLAEHPTIDRGPGIEYRLIRADHPQVMHVVMDPFTVFADLRAHQGEDFWIILHGRAELLYGRRRYPLSATETARFSGTVPHGIENPHAERAELIALSTVPYW
jgi:transcriptional regulator with XRE-family HTH domain